MSQAGDEPPLWILEGRKPFLHEVGFRLPNTGEDLDAWCAAMRTQYESTGMGPEYFFAWLREWGRRVPGAPDVQALRAFKEHREHLDRRIEERKHTERAARRAAASQARAAFDDGRLNLTIIFPDRAPGESLADWEAESWLRYLDAERELAVVEEREFSVADHEFRRAMHQHYKFTDEELAPYKAQRDVELRQEQRQRRQIVAVVAVGLVAFLLVLGPHGLVAAWEKAVQFVNDSLHSG
ncbi:MAG: hypothetical protein U0W40_16905 [Acidimicrobiia bacterium]